MADKKEIQEQEHFPVSHLSAKINKLYANDIQQRDEKLKTILEFSKPSEDSTPFPSGSLGPFPHPLPAFIEKPNSKTGVVVLRRIKHAARIHSNGFEPHEKCTRCEENGWECILILGKAAGWASHCSRCVYLDKKCSLSTVKRSREVLEAYEADYPSARAQDLQTTTTGCGEEKDDADDDDNDDDDEKVDADDDENDGDDDEKEREDLLALAREIELEMVRRGMDTSMYE